MFDILRSHLSEEEFYIIICNDKVYINNYKKIIEFDDKHIFFEVNDSIYKIEGYNLIIKKNKNKEMLINGVVESVEKI